MMATKQDIFIDKVKDGAIAGWYEGKILPSVTIAQACLESGWGTSELATKANNLFGIKAKEDWKGESYTVRTAEYDKNNKKFYIDAAFRKYRNWQCSLVDHARFFHTPAWREGNYKNVIGEVDYRKACKALQSAGYATSQSYASQLIGLIEMYHLDKYDEVAKKVSAAHKKESEVKDMVAFKYKQISNSRQIGGTRQKSSIKFIVIHYTGNPGKGATAMAHYRYLQSATRYGSAHYFVDDHEIIQVIGDSQVAWAVGDNQGHGTALNGCTNQNSISIEMCVNSDGDFNKTLYHTIELTKELLRLYPQARVCRHYDVSRKSCPSMMAGANNPKWNNFLEEIKKPRRLILDLSKDSVAKEVKGESKPMTSKKKCVMYFKDGNVDTARFIAQQLGRVPVFKDNGKDLPKEQHKDWDIVYIGDLGKDRIETGKEACKKFLGWKL